MALFKGTENYDQSFRAKNRLRDTKEFKKVYQKGKRLYQKWAVLILLPNRLGYPRLGISASRKNLGKAVNRNRAKRRARELFRRNKQKLGNYDIVMILKAPIITMNWQELENSYREVLKKLEKNKN